MRIVAHRRLPVFAGHGKNRFFYNLNVLANRRAAPMWTSKKAYTGPSG